MKQQFSIEGRPTLALFFTSGQRLIRADPDGSVCLDQDEDPEYLRSADLAGLLTNHQVMEALESVREFARANHLPLDDDWVYFD